MILITTILVGLTGLISGSDSRPYWIDDPSFYFVKPPPKIELVVGSVSIDSTKPLSELKEAARKSAERRLFAHEKNQDPLRADDLEGQEGHLHSFRRISRQGTRHPPRRA